MRALAEGALTMKHKKKRSEKTGSIIAPEGPVEEMREGGARNLSFPWMKL
jgi:hypothetical protein